MSKPFKRPTRGQLKQLRKMLQDAANPNVADHLLKGFLWAVWPEWYDATVKEIRGGAILDSTERP